MKICNACKYWEPNHGGKYEGFCCLDLTSIPHMEEYVTVKPRNTHPSVWAKHDQVRTSPTFGCNQWEGK